MLFRIVVVCMLLFVAFSPRVSFAYIQPSCELETTSEQPSSPNCSEFPSDDELSIGYYAPICNLNGTSAVAPLQVVPISDARIDRGFDCAEETDSEAWLTSPRSVFSKGIECSLNPVHLCPTETFNVPPPFEQMICFLTFMDHPAEGVSQLIERPPR